MKEYWLKVKEWWSNLGNREKQTYSIGGVFVTIFIVYQCLFSPLLENVTTLRQRIQGDRKLLVWMQQADKEINKIHPGTQAQSQASSMALLALIQKAINRDGLQQYLTQLKQAANDAIEIHFQNVKFDDMMKLLLSISREQVINITQMTVVADKTPGIVNADIVIKKS